MEKQTKLELTLPVAWWLLQREAILREIEVAIYNMFLEHKQATGDSRRTGCFHVELSLPKVEALPDLNVHPTGPECTESCLHGFGCAEVCNNCHKPFPCECSQYGEVDSGCAEEKCPLCAGPIVASAHGGKYCPKTTCKWGERAPLRLKVHSELKRNP